MKTIDVTPTWQQAVQLLFTVLENGNPEAKKMAREEITRLAKTMDAIIADHKEAPTVQQNKDNNNLWFTGKTVGTVAELKEAINDLNDQDQIVWEDSDENGDVNDLYPMYLDVIEGIELTDGTTVREVRFCRKISQS